MKELLKPSEIPHEPNKSEGNIMRSVIYGAIITVFLASAGTVRAANELDGKVLLCASKSKTYPVYGLVFDKGKVSRWQVDGYSKTIKYAEDYELVGSNGIGWYSFVLENKKGYALFRLNRQSLRVDGNGRSDQCAVSSKTKIFQKLDDLITAAKKKNKI